ncbi:histidinol-phosphate transaminase [Parahaliea mediterranea]|uniref:Histidinol-phosphate aminotransferase n=1 Tax=Parahaliea mediterranea TaxID=651086 RepID=A0A939DJI5_9GAMM|nr:histidinol-phosphate transaminase [Parahaliea mediterranea]MBN7798956.1 histidinol-phosphate transaminase [Parahaliea mediterranea]
MSRFWSAITQQLTPYVPGEQPRHQRLVKLNTNESPFDPSPAVMRAIATTTGDMLRRYPDPESVALREAIADRFDLRAEQVFVGNGSDEVLAHAFQGLLKHAAPILFPDITYSFYPVWAQLYGVEFKTVPLRADFSVDVADYRRDNGGIILPNPNAPTGVPLALAEVRRLLEGNRDSVVVIDEAYVDFGGESAAALVPEFDNLLVVHTLSKSRALAGLRVGYALGQEPLIEGLGRIKNSFNSYPLDVLAQRAALASLEDEAWFRDCCAQVIDSREFLREGLEQLGFEVLPSAANFLFASHPEREAGALFSALREQGIIVRYFNKPRIDQHLRISIGTREDCQALLAALEAML